MTREASQRRVPIPADRVGYLIATAARAPSVHNTQPWRFRAGQYVIELYADQRRKLRVDPAGREMPSAAALPCSGCGWRCARSGTCPWSNCSRTRTGCGCSPG
jgi:hypothetical protein